MLVVVTCVSQWFTLFYRIYEPRSSRARFFAYLSLFTFMMLVLVTADNFVQLFFGWEGVGLASYLLIGFWFKKPSANAAAIKAFVVNRVGDFGLILGMAAIYFTVGSLEFDNVFAAANALAEGQLEFLGLTLPALTTICLLLFMGAMGKSAQFLLHTWLPDAMEGPTPVSALIHAATMVTAGIFLVARCSPLFELSPTALTVVTVVGAVTAFFAATVGLVQNDIKRVIAYSTCRNWDICLSPSASALPGGNVSFVHARIFQGLAVLGRRIRHSRDAGRTGHAQNGWLADAGAGKLVCHDCWHIGIDGLPAHRWLFLQRRDC